MVGWLNMTRRRRSKPRGGARPGAGRKSVFGAKAVVKPFAMDFTPGGRRALDALVRRTRLSRNAVVATLALQFAETVTFDTDTPFPNKAQDVLSIRVPPEAAAKLDGARARTGHSFSDLGEALVVWHGGEGTYPTALPRPRTGARRRRQGRPPRRPRRS